MTFNELEKIGIALYGTSWQTSLARDLEINRKNIPMWSKRSCPQWLTKATLQPIVERRYNEVKQVLFLVGEENEITSNK